MIIIKKIGFLLLFALLLFVPGCSNSAISLEQFEPEMKSGNEPFSLKSNSFEADVVLDGYLDDAMWEDENTIQLGSFDDSDIENNTYGAIVGSSNNYSGTKRAIIKMFRGKVGFHFGFEVKDRDICYKALEDGDSAIWTDNILVNICSAIDGATMPMSDDYYFMVTAFNNTCFRRGANAPGMWGGFTGVLDYQAAIHHDETGECGFGVELVVPYDQIGVNKDSPIGITFKSCDRDSQTKQVVEKDWYYNNSFHGFNTPNSYIIWSGDNELFNYYDYQMPPVSIKGSVIDYVTKEPINGLQVDQTTTDDNGAFMLNNINANEDYRIVVQGDAILDNQSYLVLKNQMRASNGGIVNITIKVISKAHVVTRQVKGTVSFHKDLNDCVVVIDDNEVQVNPDGTYSIDCGFTEDKKTITVKEKGKNFGVSSDISIEEIEAPELIRDFRLPVLDKYPSVFGKGNDIKSYIGWTADGLYCRFESKTATNGYGIAISNDDETGQLFLYHQIGTLCITDYYKQVWNYANPSTYGIDASWSENKDGEKIACFEIPFELLNLEQASAVKVIPFEYALTGEFAYYHDESNKFYTFGSKEMLKQYPTFDENGKLTFAAPDVVTSSYNIDTFGKSNAKCKYEYVTGSVEGIKVTITYEAKDGLWGYGIIFGNQEKEVGTCDLYALGYGTMDHKIYGDWNWKGNYRFTTYYDVTSSEFTEDGKSVVTMFYPLSVLNGENYNLDVGESIGIQLFEYVNDSSGNLYGCYNTISIDGEQARFDTGINNFIIWNIK